MSSKADELETRFDEIVNDVDPRLIRDRFHRRTSCYLCKSILDTATVRPVRSRDPLTTGIPQQVLICRSCRLGQSDPHPDTRDLAQLYDAAKSLDTKSMMSRDFDAIRGTWIDSVKDWVARREVARQVRKAAPGRVGTVVDFGSGNGRFATAASRVCPNAKVLAVDYQTARPSALDQGVVYLTVEEFWASRHQADVIWLRHVLEHSPDPIALLSNLRRHLAPGGFLYVEVPNLDSAVARLVGGRWVGYYLPRHLFHYNPVSLPKILDAAGLAGEVQGCELPIMSNQIADLLHSDELRPTHQVLGVIAHPLQLLIEAVGRSSGSICVTARHRTSGGEESSTRSFLDRSVLGLRSVA